MLPVASLHLWPQLSYKPDPHPYGLSISCKQSNVSPKEGHQICKISDWEQVVLLGSFISLKSELGPKWIWVEPLNPSLASREKPQFKSVNWPVKRRMSWTCVSIAISFFLLTISSSRIFPGETPSPSEDPWNLVLMTSEHQKDPAKSSCKPKGTESADRGVQAESMKWEWYHFQSIHQYIFIEHRHRVRI